MMVVWGGDSNGKVNTGGRYDPATDAWTPTSTGGSVAARAGHTAIWTGNAAVIWGGHDGFGVLDTGGQYDATLDMWTPVSTAGAPAARQVHTAVWTGSDMIVWGGRTTSSNSSLGTGGRYQPLTDTWTDVSTSQAPQPRSAHSAVWTGNRMVIWGGSQDYYLNNGGQYDPATDSWIPT
jgi:N-acetylneuraminic acid mutarotase